MSFVLDLNNIQPISLDDIEGKKDIKPNEDTENEQIADNIIDIEPTISNTEPTINKPNIEIKQKTKSINQIPKKKHKKSLTLNSPLSTLHSQPSTLNSQPFNLLLSLKEAETLSGISSMSIRKAIKIKEINYSLDKGKYKINFDDLLNWCYLSTRRKNVFNTVGIGQYVNSWRSVIKE